jgi:hypothetical protein
MSRRRRAGSHLLLMPVMATRADVPQRAGADTVGDIVVQPNAVRVTISAAPFIESFSAEAARSSGTWQWHFTLGRRARLVWPTQEARWMCQRSACASSIARVGSCSLALAAPRMSAIWRAWRLARF